MWNGNIFNSDRACNTSFTLLDSLATISSRPNRCILAALLISSSLLVFSSCLVNAFPKTCITTVSNSVKQKLLIQPTNPECREGKTKAFNVANVCAQGQIIRFLGFINFFVTSCIQKTFFSSDAPIWNGRLHSSFALLTFLFGHSSFVRYARAVGTSQGL